MNPRHEPHAMTALDGKLSIDYYDVKIFFN